MGRLHCPQRRAIESLKPFAEPLPHLDNITSFVLQDGTQLHILGASNGVGSCSDIHGMDVLVVGTDPPVDRPRFPNGSSVKSCSYIVLLDENDPDYKPGSHYHKTVELLRIVDSTATHCVCIRTGHKARYVAMMM